MLYFYRLILSLAVPALALRFLWRVLRGHERWSDLRDRILGPPLPPDGTIWVHGASVGEITSAKALIETWAKARPVLVTTNTPTGRDRVSGWQITGVTARLAPLDLRWTQRSLLRRCASLVILENELWPNRLLLAHAEGIPVAVLGARLSERSAAAWERRAGLAADVIKPIAALSAQDAASEDRFRALGVSEDRLLPRADLKSLYDPIPLAIPLPGWTRERTVLFASTHPGEEAPLLQAFALAKKTLPDLRLILAPRHVERGDDIATLITASGLTCALRSAGAAPDQPIYLADTMGEMAAWYEAAAVTFVGGSLVEKGGHTPYEPCAHGSAILHGPHVSNFAESYEKLRQAEGGLAVTGPDDIARAILDHLEASSLPGNAKRALQADTNARDLSDAVLALI